VDFQKINGVTTQKKVLLKTFKNPTCLKHNKQKIILVRNKGNINIKKGEIVGIMTVRRAGFLFIKKCVY
jgi:hypothetical protein